MRRLSGETASAPAALNAASTAKIHAAVYTRLAAWTIATSAAPGCNVNSGDALCPDPGCRFGRKPLERALDQHRRVGDVQEDRAAVAADDRIVGVQRGSVKQGRERVVADDRARDRPHDRPHRHEVARSELDHRRGQVVGDVVLYRRIAERRDGAVGGRLRAQDGTAGVGQD